MMSTRRQLRTVKLCDIAYMDHIGKSKPGHLYRECFDLAGPHRNDAVVNGGQRESPDPVKQAAHRRRKFRIVHFRADTKIHSLRCASSPHTSRGIGLVPGAPMLLFSFGYRLNDGSCGGDCGLGGVDRRHDVGSCGGIQAKGSGDTGDLTGGQHQAKAQKRIIFKHHQSGYQYGGLQESGQAQADDLLAPLDEAVGIAAGHAEHIETAYPQFESEGYRRASGLQRIP